MNQIKIISRFDDTFEYLNGLLVDEKHAIYSETNTEGLTSFYFVKVSETDVQDIYEMQSALTVLAEYTKVKDIDKTLYDLKEMIFNMSFHTYITKIHSPEYSDESLGLIQEGEMKVKEWKDED